MVLGSIRNMISSWWGGSTAQSCTAQPAISKVAQQALPKEPVFTHVPAARKIVTIEDMDFIDIGVEAEPSLTERTFAAGKESVFAHFKGKQPKSSALVKKNLKTLGAQEVSLKTSSNADESFYHVKASDFAKSLNDAGGKPATLFVGDLEIPAIAFDGENGKAVIDAMVGLGICSGKSSFGMWSQCVIDGKTYLIAAESKAQINAQLNEKNIPMSSIRGEVKTQEIKFEGKKTIVLSGGVLADKNGVGQWLEAVQYLSRGIDVAMIDDKGDGKTIDSESNVNAFERRDALMHYLTVNQKIKNEDIIVKGTCYSAYHATLMAVQYPGTHLIIDQGYADMTQVAVDRDFGKQESVLKTLAKPLYENTMKVVGLDQHLDKNLLKAVKGPMCILYNQNDEIVSEDQSIQVIDSIPMTANGMVIPIDNPEIKHAGLWSKDKQVTEAMEQFLSSYCGIEEKDYFFAQQA